METKLFGIVIVDYNIISELLIKYSAFIRYQRRNGSTVGQGTSCLQILESLWLKREELYRVGKRSLVIFKDTPVDHSLFVFIQSNVSWKTIVCHYVEIF
jgi:hypothetical protein